MKIRTVLLLCCAIISGTIYAQNFSVAGVVGMEDFEPIENGTVLTFSTLDLETAAYWFSVRNESDESIELMAEFLTIDNADGTQVEFCMGGMCFTGIGTGEPYFPMEPVFLTPGSEDESGKMWNYHPGLDTEDSVIYEIKISEVDADWNFIGDPFIFTYIYYNGSDETGETSGLSDQVNENDLTIYPTVTDDLISIDAIENTSYIVFNQIGQVVLSGQLQSGISQLSIGALNSGIYFINFETESGDKVIKKAIRR